MEKDKGVLTSGYTASSLRLSSICLSLTLAVRRVRRGLGQGPGISETRCSTPSGHWH